MPRRRAPKLLDQQLTTEFAEYRALKNKIEKWLKLQSEQLIKQFKSGYVSPTGGPYLLVLAGQDRNSIDWKQEFFDRLKADFESSGSTCDVAEQLAITKMVEMERLAGKNHIDFVDVKVNPAFADKAMKVIVKKLDSSSERGF